MTPPAPAWALGAAVAVAVLFTTFAAGGFTAASRSVFAGLAGVVLLVALGWHDASARRMARTAPVVVLAALALLSVVSVAWSIEPHGSLRWGLVIAGYAALVVAGGALARTPRGIEAIALLIVAIAAVSGVIGLVAWAGQWGPYAERIYGHFRPGGPYEYPPALALVQVFALPALLRTMTRARPRLAVSAAFAAAVAACVLVLSASRWQLVLAVVVLAAALLFPARTVGAPRRVSFATVATVALAGVAVWATRQSPAASPEERIVDLFLICAGAAALWWFARGRLPALAVPRRAAAVAAVTIAVLAGVWIADVSKHGDLTHARPDQWQAAIDTARGRPVLGYGANSFLQASQRRGQARTKYAHDLPLEAWVELGVPGVALVLALYAAVGRAVWRARRSAAAWLLAPAVVAFLLTNLIDWPWHLAGLGALWAVATGAVTVSASSASP